MEAPKFGAGQAALGLGEVEGIGHRPRLPTGLETGTQYKPSKWEASGVCEEQHTMNAGTPWDATLILMTASTPDIPKSSHAAAASSSSLLAAISRKKWQKSYRADSSPGAPIPFCSQDCP